MNTSRRAKSAYWRDTAISGVTGGDVSPSKSRKGQSVVERRRSAAFAASRVSGHILLMRIS
jgi:hypothetical protein